MYPEIEEKYPEPPDRDDKIHEAEIDKELLAWVKKEKIMTLRKEFEKSMTYENGGSYSIWLENKYEERESEREFETEEIIDQWAKDNSVNLIAVEKLKDEIFKEE